MRNQPAHSRPSHQLPHAPPSGPLRREPHPCRAEEPNVRGPPTPARPRARFRSWRPSPARSASVAQPGPEPVELLIAQTDLLQVTADPALALQVVQHVVHALLRASHALENVTRVAAGVALQVGAA